MNNEIKKKGTPSFDTIDGATLMSTPLQPLRFVVDSLISHGLHVPAGSPKVGISSAVKFVWSATRITSGSWCRTAESIRSFWAMPLLLFSLHL